MAAKVEPTDRLAACLEGPRAPEAVRHGLADSIRFRLLVITAGYEDGNHAAALWHDPAFKLALDRLRLSARIPESMPREDGTDARVAFE